MSSLMKLRHSSLFPSGPEAGQISRAQKKKGFRKTGLSFEGGLQNPLQNGIELEWNRETRERWPLLTVKIEGNED
jgi:hypothetical protein